MHQPVGRGAAGQEPPKGTTDDRPITTPKMCFGGLLPTPSHAAGRPSRWRAGQRRLGPSFGTLARLGCSLQTNSTLPGGWAEAKGRLSSRSSRL